MKVLALTHGPSVGPGVFGEAVRDAGHELVEWRVPRRRRAAGGGRRGARLRRRDAPRRGRAARLAAPRAATSSSDLLERRHAAARRLPRRAADRPRGRRRGARGAEPEVGWLPVELTDAGRDDPGRGLAAAALRRLPVAPLHARASGRRRGAGAERRLHAGVPARQRVGCPVPPGGARGAGRRLARRGPLRRPPTPSGSARRRASGSSAWNDLGRELCGAFLATV